MAHFDAITAAKRAPRRHMLEALRPRVEQRMDMYQGCAPHLEQIAREQFEEDEHRALLHCYDTKSEARDRLQFAIRDSYFQNAPSDRCPYCGINEASEIDHYLPCVAFPELAVCHLNMLPACGTCNLFKGERWHDRGERPCVHLYFDPVADDHTYLHAEIMLDAPMPGVTYQLRMPPCGDRDYFALYQRHCDTLRLFDRFSRAALGLLGDIREQVSTLRHSTRAATQESIREIYGKKRRRLGANHWQTALWRAASESVGLLDWCLPKAPRKQETP